MIQSKSNKQTYAFNLINKIINQKNDNIDIILKPRKKLTAHTGIVLEFEWGGLRNVTELISCDDAGAVIHWNGSKGKRITIFSVPNQRFCTVDIDQEYGRVAIIGSYDGKLILAELNNENTTTKAVLNSTKLFEIAGHSSQVSSCKFLNGTYFISGSADKSVCVWDIKTTKESISKNQAHNGGVKCLSVSEKDGNIFLSGGADQLIKIWDIRVKNPIQAEFKGHTGSINDIKFLPGQFTTFVSGSDDASLRVFDIRLDKEVAILTDTSSADAVRNICISNSGRIIFAATENKFLKLWDLLAECDPIQYIDYGFSSGLRCARLSADGYSIAVSGDDGAFGIAY